MKRHANEDWERIQRAFDALIELDVGERTRRLELELAGRQDLASEVERLLDATRGPSDFLERPAVDLLEDAAGPGATEPDLAPGAGVGGYDIVSRISSGGMGDVYLAERQVGGARRRVAVKVLKRGMDTAALLRRFAIEKEALAGLHHENIVSFLDAGALDDGRPFLVMEHVDGVSLTEYCRANALGVRERLELFLDVARAVQFAHANLVLHCDLKPSNVLVTPAGTVVLLDFGVAKLLEGDDASDPTRTFVPLTPRYASPEQLERRRLTVATDVFALGLVLYELLGERPAFPDATFAAPRPEPPPPSALANRRALRGDLDAIVARAIEPDPGRRYASVELLALDVRRYLDGEPVSARRADAWNRAVKLMRRNRVLAGALAGLILVLGAGLVGTSLGKTRAEDNASRGWGAHAQARFASEVIADVLVAGATSGASWDAVLDEAETRLATELSHLPETEALTRLALGRLALSLGQPERAGGHLERALELARSRRGLNWRDTASAYELLAEARWDTDRAAAVAALEAALAVRLDASAPDPDAVEATRRTLARARAD